MTSLVTAECAYSNVIFFFFFLHLLKKQQNTIRCHEMDKIQEFPLLNVVFSSSSVVSLS